MPFLPYNVHVGELKMKLKCLSSFRPTELDGLFYFLFLFFIFFTAIPFGKLRHFSDNSDFGLWL